jgi:hypothetical protein
MEIRSLVTVRDTLKFTAATQAGGPVFSPGRSGQSDRSQAKPKTVTNSPSGGVDKGCSGRQRSG